VPAIPGPPLAEDGGHRLGRGLGARRYLRASPQATTAARRHDVFISAYLYEPVIMMFGYW
jgi:hypothetical protein